MLNGPLVPAIMRFAIPVFLTTFLQNLFNTADMIVIGQFCGSLKVAAVSSTSSLTNLLIGLFTGLSLGAGLTVARAIGTQTGGGYLPGRPHGNPPGIDRRPYSVRGGCVRFSATAEIAKNTGRCTAPIFTIHADLLFRHPVYGHL